MKTEHAAEKHEPWCASLPRAFDTQLGRGPFPCDCKPKPAGEWTHEKLQGLLQISNEDRYVADHAFENTLDEINAELAAEREKHQTTVDGMDDVIGEANRENHQLREQLAAEREDNKQLRAAQQPLVDALEEISDNAIPSDDRFAADCAEAALAKVEDGKCG